MAAVRGRGILEMGQAFGGPIGVSGSVGPYTVDLTGQTRSFDLTAKTRSLDLTAVTRSLDLTVEARP